MEALAGVRSYLDTIRQDYVVLLEGDLVVNLPLAEIFETHLQTGADKAATVLEWSKAPYPVTKEAFMQAMRDADAAGRALLAAEK